jgi:hypothetical protein
MFPVKYELGFYIPENCILHTTAYTISNKNEIRSPLTKIYDIAKVCAPLPTGYNSLLTHFFFLEIPLWRHSSPCFPTLSSDDDLFQLNMTSNFQNISRPSAILYE